MENLFETKTINPRRQQQQVTNNNISSSAKCNGRRYYKYNNYAPRNQFYGNRRRYNRHYYDDENYYITSRFTKNTSSSSSSSSMIVDAAGVDFSKLPSIVLANIYSHLDLTDRLTASSVCKSWRGALLNTPHLWHRFHLVIYLLNVNRDLRSAQFKCASLAKYAQALTLNYDPRNMFLYEPLVQQVLSQLAHSSHNLKQLTLVPILNYSSSYYNHHYHYQHALVSSLNKRCFESLNNIVLGAKCIEHLALGCLTDLNYQRISSNRNNYLVELIGALAKKQLYNLKSLHVSSVCSSPILAFRSNKYDKKQRNNNNDIIGRQFYLSNLLTQFVNLTQLSIDYDDLSNEFLNSTVCLLSLKKLNLNVNTFDGVTDNTDELRVRDGAWESLTSRNKSFRVCVNFLSLEETSQKYQLVLSPFMPLQTLRMYFCKSLNPDMLHYLSNTYSESLASLVVVDSISTEYDEWLANGNNNNNNNLYYHNALRYDADPDPDPLVLLSWKCKHLSELIIVGYELLEINLTAIAKLRSTGLKSFYVARDCVMNLRYGHYRHNGGFVEDDEGEDTMPDYGGTQSLLDKMRDSLNAPDWHPLEQDELPNSVYDWRVPDEEAYLDALITDQTFDPRL